MVLGDWNVPSKYMSYILPTDADEVPAVILPEALARVLEKFRFTDWALSTSIDVGRDALREALANAIRHGNRLHRRQLVVIEVIGPSVNVAIRRQKGGQGSRRIRGRRRYPLHLIGEQLPVYCDLLGHTVG